MDWQFLAPYLAIPLIMTGVAWLTNWLAIEMLFKPVQFVGFGNYFGWQGIIPRLRVRLTRNLVDISVAKICSPQDIARVLSEPAAVQQMIDIIAPQVDTWVDDIIEEYGLGAWQLAPQTVRKLVYDQVKKQLPSIAQGMLRDMGEEADSFINIRELAIAQVADQPQLLNDLFLKCAGNEIRFVVRSGLYFGFPLGVLQATAWYLYPKIWILPLFGVMVGAGTNWLALKLIAHPAEPVRVGPWTLHGLYLRRQAVVSEVFAEVFCDSFLNSKLLVDHLWSGEHAFEIQRLVRRHVRSSFDRNMVSKLLGRVVGGRDSYEDIEKKSIQQAIERITVRLDDPQVNEQISKPIRQLIAQRMGALSSREFQQLLLPAFEQDQLLVVLAGGLLGGLVGLAQLIWLFGA
ncbi:MAG: DUF445 domain-containing protein [Oceanococcus sp.]